jgi:hypothetical protein
VSEAGGQRYGLGAVEGQDRWLHGLTVMFGRRVCAVLQLRDSAGSMAVMEVHWSSAPNAGLDQLLLLARRRRRLLVEARGPPIALVAPFGGTSILVPQAIGRHR